MAGPSRRLRLDARVAERLKTLTRSEAVVGLGGGAARDMYAMLESSLAQAGIAIHDAFAERLCDRARPARLGPGAQGQTWLDLDPSLPGAVAGALPAAPVASSGRDPGRFASSRAGLRIIVESISGGTLREETVLEVSEFADVLAAEPIGVLNIEREGLKALGASISAGLEGGTAYVPCVAVGRQVVVGSRPVRFGGVAAAGPFAGTFAPSGPLFEGRETTAEWVAATVASPGREPHIVRRGSSTELGRRPGRREGTWRDCSPRQLVSLRAGAAPDFPPALTSHWLTLHNRHGRRRGTRGEAPAAPTCRRTLVNATHAGTSCAR